MHTTIVVTKEAKMKKTILGAIGVMLVGASILFSPHASVEQIYDPVAITGFDDQMTERFFKGELPNVVLELSQGMVLPFNVLINGDFFELDLVDQPPYRLIVHKTCYMRCLGDNMLFSRDLLTWKEFQDFFSGSIGFALKDGNSEIMLNMEMNQRPQ
jgi:hypothetical protein